MIKVLDNYVLLGENFFFINKTKRYNPRLTKQSIDCAWKFMWMRAVVVSIITLNLP